ncbi:hypothetical protein LTS18_006646, partial [Coniosporium uncinatum]
MVTTRSGTSVHHPTALTSHARKRIRNAAPKLSLKPKPEPPPTTNTLLLPPPRALIRPKSPTEFGLIQERLNQNLYHLITQSILWNQTSGRAARPVLETLLALYPSPAALAAASLPQLTAILQPI